MFAMKIDVPKLRSLSVVCKAGCRFMEATNGNAILVPRRSPDDFVLGNTTFKMAPRACVFEAAGLTDDSFHETIADGLDGMAFDLVQRLVNASKLKSSELFRFTPGDYYRLIVSVEESNARFAAFVLSEELSRHVTQVCGYPAFASRYVPPGRMLGGDWDYLRVLIVQETRVERLSMAEDVDQVTFFADVAVDIERAFSVMEMLQ